MLRHPLSRCNFRQHFDNTLTRSPRQKSVFAHVEDVFFYLDAFRALVRTSQLFLAL